MHDVDAVRARQFDHAPEEVQIDALRGRIARETQHHHPRLRKGFADRALQLPEEVRPVSGPHRADVGSGDDRAVDVDRIAWIRNQDRIAAVQGGEHQVGQALLGADRDDRLGIGIDPDLEPVLVPVGNRAAQPGDSLGHRIAVGILPLYRFDQLVDDVPGRGAVRIAHAHVDDVLATAPGRHFQLGRDVEHVRRKPLDVWKFGRDVLHGGLSKA